MRLSISGWYHGPCPPIGADKASLNQVMSVGEDVRGFGLFPSLNTKYYEKLQKKENEMEDAQAAAKALQEAVEIAKKKEKKVGGLKPKRNKSKQQNFEEEKEEDPLSPKDRLYLSKYVRYRYYGIFITTRRHDV